MGGTVAIQTQWCLYKRDEDDLETDDEAGAREGTAVQLVDPMPWHRRAGSGFSGAPDRPPPAMPRSLSETTTIVPSQRR